MGKSARGCCPNASATAREGRQIARAVILMPARLQHRPAPGKIYPRARRIRRVAPRLRCRRCSKSFQNGDRRSGSDWRVSCLLEIQTKWRNQKEGPRAVKLPTEALSFFSGRCRCRRDRQRHSVFATAQPGRRRRRPYGGAIGSVRLGRRRRGGASWRKLRMHPRDLGAPALPFPTIWKCAPGYSWKNWPSPRSRR